MSVDGLEEFKENHAANCKFCQANESRAYDITTCLDYCDELDKAEAEAVSRELDEIEEKEAVEENE